jgi:tRNA threonylcarbamoyladenosine biosynthesis protein TsaB
VNILAFDTSSEILSVAWMSGPGLVSVQRDLDLAHAETLFDLIDFVIQHSAGGIEALDCLAIAAGPGSFTGLRIGFAAARGLMAGSGKPLVAVPTLELHGRSLAGAGAAIIPVMHARKIAITARFSRPANA